MQLTLIEKKQEVPDVVSFIFRPAEPFSWRAGQLLHYTLPHPEADDRGTERYFTISSAPHESHVVITTRLSEQSSTFKKALQKLPIGGTISADGLEGDFVIDDPKGEYVFIAGGIGITPIRSIMVDLDHRGESLQGTLLYSNRDEHFVFKEELEALVARHPGLRIVYLVSPDRIDEATIQKHVPDVTKPVFYISGPEPMVQAFQEMLTRMGVPEEHQKRDEFPGYPAH